MNAAMLNSSRGAGTLNAGPFRDEPGRYGLPPGVTAEQVSGGVVVTAPSVPRNGLDLDAIKDWASTGQKLLDAGKNPGMSVNPSELLSAVAAGAVAGSAIPGVGTVAGAIVAGVVYVVSAFIGGAFGPGPSIYDNAGPNVHWWFTNYAPEAYLQWVLANGSNAPFASVQAAAQGFLVYLLQTYGYVAMPPPWSWATYAGWNRAGGPRLDYDYVWDATGIADHAAKEPWLQSFYANFGVDWSATRDAWANRPVNSPGALFMKDRRFVSDSELQEAEQNVDDDTSSGPESSDGKKLAVGLGVTLAALALLNKSN